MIWRLTILPSFLLGLLFLNFASVKGGPLSENDTNSPSGPKTESGNDADSSDFIITAFSSILQSNLKSSDILTNFFRNPLDGDTAANMASAIAESMALEVGIPDAYAATDLIIDALLSVKPSAGPEAYGTALENVLGKILQSNKILNTENYFTLANTISRIITTVTSDSGNSIKRNGPRNIKKATKDIDVGLDIGAGIKSNILGLQLNSNALDVNTNLKSLSDVNANVGLSQVVNPNNAVDVGVKSDLSVSEEANLQFKFKLTNELLKDITFRNVFSGYIPPNALKQIAASVCQYISKAFHVSRLFLLPLETSLGNLSFDSSPSPELYVNIITSILTDLFGKSKFITKDTSALQAIITANAVSSGIANLIRIAAIPGVGFSINEKTFSSFFSALNGLEKLPYVGVEAASPKLSLAAKLTYASRYASQFANILFYNLVSSRKFLEIFPPGVRTVTNKYTAKSLGNAVAESFGSPNPNLFYDLYCKALLSSAIKLNRVNYARDLSFATARALFLNGYFLSGNINIQAAIAKNAIVRALTANTRPVSTQVTPLPILGLPWVTQLEGVLPSQILLKYGTDVGLNAGVDGSISTKTDTASGVGVNMNTGLGTGLGINVGIGGLGANIGLGGDLGSNIGLGGGLGAKVGLGGVLGANAGLGGGIASNVGLKGGIGANIGLGGGLNTNVGLGGGLGAKAGLGDGLNANVGLGGGFGANFGLQGGLGANLDLGIGLDTNAGLSGILGSNVGLKGALGTNAGLAGRVGGKIGLGTELDVNAGLGTNAGINVGLGTRLGANNRLGATAGVNTGLGAVGNVNAGLEAVAGLNTGLGAAAGLNTALRTNLGINSGLATGLDVKSGLRTNFDAYAGLGSSANRKKRSIDNLSTSADVDLGTSVAAGVGLNSGGVGVNARLGILDKNVANVGILTGANKGSGIGTNLDTGLGINTNSGANADKIAASGNTSNTQLSVLNVLPLILADKLYQSTALYTSVSMIGIRKIITLIAQAMAAEFGLPIATIFLSSYDQFSIHNYDNTFEINMVGLAKATTEALAGTGMLSSKFSLSTANQLADAIASKFSSLIATSLEAKEVNKRPQWTYLLNQNLVQPPLFPDYNIFK